MQQRTMTPAPVNPRQIKKLHTLLSSLDMMEDKRELISRYSHGRTISSRDLYFSEAARLIEALEDQAGTGDPNKAKRQRMIRKMMHYGYLMQFDSPRYESHHLKKSTICYRNVDAWCRSDKCAIGKPLDRMTLQELNKALSQFELMYKHTLNKI